MPKGRHLKPEFFTDKHIVTMSPLARLLYQGLWCYSADCGHLPDEPIEFKMRILPADNCEIEDLLAELVMHGRIIRDNGTIFLPTLGDHARIDKRYETLCDACREPGGVNAARFGNHVRWHQKRSVIATDCEFCTSDNGSSHVVDTMGQDPEPDTKHAAPHRNHVADGDGDGDGDGDTPTGREIASTPGTAQALVKEWIDHCGQRPPGRVIGHVSKELKTMLDENIAYDDVRRGLAAWQQKSLNPGALASVVHEVRTGGGKNRRQQETDQFFDRATTWAQKAEAS